MTTAEKYVEERLREVRYAIESELHRLHLRERQALGNHDAETALSLLAQTVGLKKALTLVEEVSARVRASETLGDIPRLSSVRPLLENAKSRAGT